jgi:multiple sugar transport system permease protein
MTQAPTLGRSRRTQRTGFLFVLPTLIVMFSVTIVPAIFLYLISLFDYNRGTPLSSARWVGLENYTRLLSGQDDNFWPAVGVTLLFLVTATATTVLFGTVLAILLDSVTRARSLFTTLMLIPLIMAPVIAGLIWRLMFNDLYGVVNAILAPFGASQPWLGSPSLAFISVLIVETWQWTPFVALIIFAGIQSVDGQPREAAMIDGANAFQLFRYVTFPMIQPIFGLVVVLRLIDSMKIFDSAYALTQGGPGKATETLSLMVWHYGLYQTGWIGRAAAVAVLLLVMVVLLSNVVTRYLKRAEELQG